MGAAEAFGGSIHYRLKNPVPVLIQIIVPDTQHRPSFRAEEAVAVLIDAGLGVLASVKLHNQLCLPARKISEVGTDR